jgi:hypothetical protein
VKDVSPKVSVPVLAGAIITIAFALLRQYTAVELGATEQAAATVIVAAVLGYLVPDPKRI